MRSSKGISFLKVLSQSDGSLSSYEPLKIVTSFFFLGLIIFEADITLLLLAPCSTDDTL